MEKKNFQYADKDQQEDLCYIRKIQAVTRSVMLHL